MNIYTSEVEYLRNKVKQLEEALAQPEQRAQLLFEVDGEMLTASQMMGVELFNFQQATGCDTAAEFLAQPEQEQNLKLMPREATPEMLKAMDECSTEGYDERLYEGHAGSVYMAAWDAFHGQHCYCGDITNLGVIHRDDGPCHYPDHKEPEQEPVAWRAWFDADNSAKWLFTLWPEEEHPSFDWQPLYTHPPVTTAQPEQEPVAWMYPDALCDRSCLYVCTKAFTQFPECANTPPQRTWVGLTDLENAKFVKTMERGNFLVAIYDIEKKLKELNT